MRRINKKNIKIMKYFSNSAGSEVTNVSVSSMSTGFLSTKISKYKDNGKFQLSLDTTPKTPLINTDTDFNTVEEATKYYLDNLEKYAENLYSICLGGKNGD